MPPLHLVVKTCVRCSKGYRAQKLFSVSHSFLLQVLISSAVSSLSGSVSIASRTAHFNESGVSSAKDVVITLTEHVGFLSVIGVEMTNISSNDGSITLQSSNTISESGVVTVNVSAPLSMSASENVVLTSARFTSHGAYLYFYSSRVL